MDGCLRPEQILVRMTDEQLKEWTKARTKNGQMKREYWTKQMKAGKITRSEFDFIMMPEECAVMMITERLKQNPRSLDREPMLESADPEDELVRSANHVYTQTLLTIWAKCGLVEMRIIMPTASA